MLRDIASEVYTTMRDTAQGAPDTKAVAPNPAGPACLASYAADQMPAKAGSTNSPKFVEITSTEKVTEIHPGARVLLCGQPEPSHANGAPPPTSHGLTWMG